MGILHKRPSEASDKKLVMYTLGKVWRKLQTTLSPGISPLASFLCHLDFRTALSIPTFPSWEEGGLGQFCSLGKDKQMFTLEFIGNVLEGSENVSFQLFYQFRQVSNFINNLLEKSDIFWSFSLSNC